jgi:hypothetical protein
MSPNSTNAWKALESHASGTIATTHLRELLADDNRNDCLCVDFGGIVVDFSHQRMTGETFSLLLGAAPISVRQIVIDHRSCFADKPHGSNKIDGGWGSHQ